VLPLARSARRTLAAVSAAALVTGLAATATGPSYAAPGARAAARADVAPTPGGLDLATASIADLQTALTEGRTTSVELVEAYLDRIGRLDSGGPSINAIRHLSADALADARAADAARAAGEDTGPLSGIPILIKDNIDHAGDPTTAGSVALANSFPASNAPVTDSLEEAGAIILGKTNLTEFANYMTNGMPAGYSSLGGQVLNPYDLSQTPSGSSAGSGAGAAASLAAAAVGTETSGSILSPSNANSLVGIKPTVGLISRTGIVPISATQDTAGPMARSVADAAAMLTGMTTGADPEDPATEGGVDYDDVDYTAGLSEEALDGVRLGFVASNNAEYNAALDVLRAEGATLVQVTAPAGAAAPSILTPEFKRDLNAYLARLPESAPRKTLSDVIAYNDANPGVALKFGQTLLTAAQDTDLSDPDQAATYQANRDLGLQQSRTNIDTTLTTNDVEAIVSNAATTGVGARAGYPSLTLPAGYAAANRRPVPITFLGTAYSEETLIDLAYDYEQAAQVRRSPQELNPSAFACTGVSPETDPDAPGADCGQEEADPVASVTLASLTKSVATQGRRPARVRVAVAAGAVTPTGRVTASTRGARFGATLDDDGRAVLTVPRRLKPGRYVITVAYAGSAEVQPSRDTVTLRINPRR